MVVRERTEEEETVGEGEETGGRTEGLDDAGEADVFDRCDRIFARLRDHGVARTGVGAVAWDVPAGVETSESDISQQKKSN